MNLGNTTLMLHQFEPPGCRKGIAMEQVVQLAPGEGKRVASYERNCWEAREMPDGGGGGGPRGGPGGRGRNAAAAGTQWTIDRADGLVQDVILPLLA